MHYKIKAWIPCEEEYVEVYSRISYANTEANELKSMQPENHYEVVECDENGEDI